MDTFEDEFLEDDDLEQGRAATKEQVVFLIDSQSYMSEPCNHPDKELQGCSWVQLAVKVAAEVLRQKVIQSERDELAVVFYNTRGMDTETGEHVTVLQKLEEPDVRRIQELQGLGADESAFAERIGSRAGPPSAQAFRAALTQSASMFRESRQARTSRRVLVFTGDDSPVHEGQARARAVCVALQGVLHEGGGGAEEQRAALQLFPMVLTHGTQHPFDLKNFWEEALALTRSDGEVEYEEDEQIGSVDDLRTGLRSKAYKKRALSSLTWRLGEGVELGMQLFAAVQPARRASYAWVEAETLDEVKPDTRLIDNFTGAILEPEEGEAQQSHTFFPNPRQFPSARFPQVGVSRGEVQKIKAVHPPGLTLLGFKPLTALRDYHQLRNASFMYPDEASVSGSSMACGCLHRALLDSESFALCSFRRSRVSEPRLVAALPQEQGEEGEGFQMIYLPYVDDIREPERDMNFTGAQRADVQDHHVKAACALLGALELGGFSSGGVTNPHLQRHFQVLESLALGMDPPSLEDFLDETLPQGLDDPEAVMAIQEFKDNVYGEGYTGDIAPVKGAKRKAAPSAADAAELAADVEALNIPGKAAKGKLGTLTIPKLQLYLQFHGLPKTGKKEELVTRITNHLSSKT